MEASFVAAPPGRSTVPRSLTVAVVTVGLAAGAEATGAQTLRGTVLDGSNQRPVPLAGVYLLDSDREVLEVTMADSLGRYFLAVPDPGEYLLFAQRFGYTETESPLLAVRTSGDYAIDLELRPEALRLGGLDVTVEGGREVVIGYLKRLLGGSPYQAFGFRLLQGVSLEEAKLKAGFDPTSTLRWLYVPVSHGTECVRLNALPRAASATSRGSRVSPFAVGAAPLGTRTIEDALAPLAASGCGNLFVDERWMPNDLFDTVDMSRIASIALWPGVVRMYTYGFDFSTVGTRVGGPPR